MADAVWIEFKQGMTEAIYRQVNDRVNPSGTPPAGLLFHCAGPSPAGGWRIVDVWDRRETFDRFLESQVLPALAAVIGEEAMAQGAPPEVVSWPVANHNTGPAL